jgi:hypothetical protein
MVVQYIVSSLPMYGSAYTIEHDRRAPYFFRFFFPTAKIKWGGDADLEVLLAIATTK